MVIHFNQELVARVLDEIKDAHDFSDIVRDIDKINNAAVNIQTFGGVENARKLDRELRQKYPCIDVMLSIAQTMAPQTMGQMRTGSDGQPEIDRLMQDRYGIICGAAVKKGIVHEIKDMIRQVD